MCIPATPPLAFTAHAAPIWADVINHLSGYVVDVTMNDGATVHGELLGDGETGRYLSLLVDGRQRTILARSVEKITIL